MHLNRIREDRYFKDVNKVKKKFKFRKCQEIENKKYSREARK
jgi:hypothetical protein